MKGIAMLPLLLFLLSTGEPHSFKQQQMAQSRVKGAYQNRWHHVDSLLHKANIQADRLELFIRILKKEQSLEVWGRNKGDRKFRQLTHYKVCSLSGKLGPKRKQGDLQVPEGFYEIEQFNPWSSYHLSLKVSYPNQSDRILGHPTDPGGLIFIHGDCVTIGCVPITDEWIDALYILATEARSNGQRHIPVHIFPACMEGESWTKLQTAHQANAELIQFWKGLKPGWDHFERYKQPPQVDVLKNGAYAIH